MDLYKYGQKYKVSKRAGSSSGEKCFHAFCHYGVINCDLVYCMHLFLRMVHNLHQVLAAQEYCPHLCIVSMDIKINEACTLNKVADVLDISILLLIIT